MMSNKSELTMDMTRYLKQISKISVQQPVTEYYTPGDFFSMCDGVREWDERSADIMFLLSSLPHYNDMGQLGLTYLTTNDVLDLATKLDIIGYYIYLGLADERGYEFKNTLTNSFRTRVEMYRNTPPEQWTDSPEIHHPLLGILNLLMQVRNTTIDERCEITREIMGAG